MGDLIDRDALGVGPANPNVFKHSAYADGWNALLKIIKQAPVIVAAPVVHGKWKMVGADKRGRGGIFVCSACDKCSAFTCDYCPNCGAKMDGEGKTE